MGHMMEDPPVKETSSKFLRHSNYLVGVGAHLASTPSPGALPL